MKGKMKSIFFWKLFLTILLAVSLTSLPVVAYAMPDLQQTADSGTQQAVAADSAITAVDSASDPAIIIDPQDTYKVQERLTVLGYLNVPYNGYYGDATRLAVKEFQMFNGLSITGEMDEKTAQELGKNNANKRRALYKDKSGEDVTQLQGLLHDLGFLEENYSEGSFDDDTDAAVREFQMCNNLAVDGSVGNITLEKLLTDPVTYDEYAQLAATGPQATNPMAKQMAVNILNLIGWDLKAAYNWAVAIPYTRAQTGNTTSDCAVFSFTAGAGDCIGKASVFCWMARMLGYSCRVIRGYVPMAAGGFGEHGWTEIDINGVTYVCDPQFEWDDHLNGYMITYGQSGTWVYQYGYIMKD